MLANVSYYIKQLRPLAWANKTREKFGKIGIHNQTELEDAINFGTLNHRLMSTNLSTMHNTLIKTIVEAMPDD